MNVFELASQFKQLEALVDSDLPNIDQDELLQHWLAVEGDLNQKIENIGFAIRNRQSALAGKQKAIKDMESSAVSLENEIERLERLAIGLLTFKGQKKAGGHALTLSIVRNQPSVAIEKLEALPPEYFREVPAVPASRAPDKKKLADDLKAGVIVSGAKLIPSVRLAIK
jgi:phosphoserine aminotransferase